MWGLLYVAHCHAHPHVYRPALQFDLRRAAKARIDRMVAPKTKRKDLAVPEYVAKEWTEGDKNGMADLLLRCNFSKDWVSEKLWGGYCDISVPLMINNFEFGCGNA